LPIVNFSQSVTSEELELESVQIICIFCMPFY
jgi:hypothetical protein